MSAVLQPIEDIEILVTYVLIYVYSLTCIRKKGHVFEVRSETKTYYGTISVTSADNQGSNGLGGFKESVSSTRYCRQCMVDSLTAQQQV